MSKGENCKGRGEKLISYLRKPSADVVPAYSDDVSAFETPASWMIDCISFAFSEEAAIAETQVVDQSVFFVLFD